MINAVIEHGLDGLPQAIAILINEAMKAERNAVLRAAPYQRTQDRKGYSNGFKSRTLNTRLGPLQLAVPQVRVYWFSVNWKKRGIN